MSILKNQATVPLDNITKDEAKTELKEIRKSLFDLQHRLFAEGKTGVLIILQGIDTAGKDGVIRHVISGMNPSGVLVKSFQAPTEEEKKHDFLWRVYPNFPERGMIRVFNRSHYEDILVPMANKKISNDTLQHRVEMINSAEKHLIRNNTVVLKFFLNISKNEQRERLDERKHRADKQWKYHPSDELAHKNWDRYREGFDLILEKCNDIPWHIIPSDKKWYRNLSVARILENTLNSINPQFPQ